MSRGALNTWLSRSRYEKRTEKVFCTRSKKRVRKSVLTFRAQDLVDFVFAGLVHPWGRIGYFLNDRGFSVESSLQSISSNSFLWKRTNWLVVIHAGNVRPTLEHGCGKWTKSDSIFILLCDLLYVPDIKMWRKVWSRSVHNFGTCKKNAAARRRLLIKQRVCTQNLSEVASEQPHYLCKFRSCVQT